MPYAMLSRRRFLAAAAAGGTAVGLGLPFRQASAADYPKMTLKFGHPYAEAHPLAQSAVRFAEMVKERSGGNIQVDLFPAGALGNPNDMLDGLGMGVVDFTLVPSTNVATRYAPLDLFYLPYLFRDHQHAYDTADGDVGRELNKGLTKATGLKSFGMFESGFRTITTANTKVEKPEDLRGVKIRVTNSPINIATFKVLGANATPLPASELFPALQQGAVDGQDNPIGNVLTMGFYSVQKYITLSNHQWAGVMMLGSSSAFDSMPENVQTLLTQAATEARDWERQTLVDSEEHDKKALAEAGMTIINLTPEQKDAFIAQTQPVWDEFSAKIGPDLIAQVKN